MNMSSPISLILAVSAVSLLNGCADGDRAASTVPTDKAMVMHLADAKVVKMPWGELTWFVGADLHNSANMTMGQCLIHPGQQNPRHYHPNCDELLHVVSGTILNSMEDGRTETMHAGDTVSIPAGVHHNAKNVGTDDAIMIISYSSANRQVVGE